MKNESSLLKYKLGIPCPSRNRIAAMSLVAFAQGSYHMVRGEDPRRTSSFVTLKSSFECLSIRCERDIRYIRALGWREPMCV